MQDEPETAEPEQTTPPPPPEEGELAPDKPIDSYAGFRDDLKTQLENQYQEKMTGFLHPDPNPSYAASAASIVAQTTLRYLPPEGGVTEEQVSQAITAAQSDLADRRLWYQAVLPDDPLRIDIANRIAQRYTPDKIVTRKLAKTRGALRAAVDEYRQSAEQAHDQLPKREDLLPAVQSELQKSGITDKKLYTKQATKISKDLDAWTFTYKAAPPPEVIQTTIQRHVGKHLEDTQDLVKRLSQNPTVSKHYEAGSQHRHLVATGLTKTINKAASSRLVRGARKASRALNIISRPLTYAGRGVRKVITAPVRFVTRPVGRVVKRGVRRVAIGTARLVAKGLVKVGLGGLVRNVERIALAGTGVGIPILIAQEAALFGAGQLFKARKALAESWRRATQSRNVGEALINNVGASIDTLGAGIGGIVGGTVGTGLGALGGAIIGSVVGPIGTVIGGILGGAAGGLFGAGAGANFGANIRKHLKRLLAIKLFLQLLKQQLVNLLNVAGRILGAAGLGAVAGSLLIPIPIVGTIIGGVLGGIAGYLLPQAITAAKQLAFITQYTTVSTLAKASTAARQLLFIGKNALTTGFAQTTSTIGQFIASGEGIAAQTLRGIGNILGKIPSGIAQAFNTVTGWIAGGTSTMATTTEAVLGEITTVGPGAALVATPVAAIAAVGILGLITYNVLITAFFVPPTEVDPYFEDPTKFVRISKIACVGGSCGIESLPNPETVGYTITYQITVTSEAVDQTIIISSITDEYTTFGDNNPPTPATIEWGGTTLAPGESWSPPSPPQVIINAGDNRWFDSLLTNTITATFSVAADPTEYESSESVTIIIGEPPFCPPSLSPFGDDPYRISGYRWDPARHPGVDLAASVGQPWNVRSTHACRAEVAYVQDNPSGNCFGKYVVLQSGPYYTFHAHLTSTSVSEGQTVGPGHVVGQINGTTGCSTGPHDHYEIRLDPGVVPASDWQPVLALNPCEYGINCD